MGLDSPPPSTCVHLSLIPFPPPCGRHKRMAPIHTMLLAWIIKIDCFLIPLQLTKMDRARSIMTNCSNPQDKDAFPPVLDSPICKKFLILRGKFSQFYLFPKNFSIFIRQNLILFLVI